MAPHYVHGTEPPAPRSRPHFQRGAAPPNPTMITPDEFREMIADDDGDDQGEQGDQQESDGDGDGNGDDIVFVDPAEQDETDDTGDTVTDVGPSLPDFDEFVAQQSSGADTDTDAPPDRSESDRIETRTVRERLRDEQGWTFICAVCGDTLDTGPIMRSDGGAPVCVGCRSAQFGQTRGGSV